MCSRYATLFPWLHLRAMTAPNAVTPATFSEFHSYVMGFYGPDGIYPLKRNGCFLTLAAVKQATAQLLRDLREQRRGFEGDSVDREQVRELLLGQGYQFPPVGRKVSWG